MHSPFLFSSAIPPYFTVILRLPPAKSKLFRPIKFDKKRRLLLFTHVCPATGFCRCYAFQIGKICCRNCIVRNFQFRKFLPVNSNRRLHITIRAESQKNPTLLYKYIIQNKSARSYFTPKIAMNVPAATAVPITPATFGPIACIRRKLLGSASEPTFLGYTCCHRNCRYTCGTDQRVYLTMSYLAHNLTEDNTCCSTQSECNQTQNYDLDGIQV